MGGTLGMAACFLAVVALIIGFVRDPYAPLSTALKWFGILFLPLALWLMVAAGSQQ